MDPSAIGKYICRKRNELKMSQKKLAERIGVSDKTVSKWERGESIPEYGNIEALAQIFNVSPDELIKGISVLSKDYKVKNSNESNLKKGKLFIKMLLFTVIGLIIIILFRYFVYNYNQIKMYSMVSQNEDYAIEGYLFSSQERNVIIVNSIVGNLPDLGTENETQVLNISLFLEYEDRVICGGTEDFKEAVPLTEALKSAKLSISEQPNNGGSFWNSNNIINGINLVIGYLDENLIYTEQKIKLNFDEIFSNNNFYNENN